MPTPTPPPVRRSVSRTHRSLRTALPAVLIALLVSTGCATKGDIRDIEAQLQSAAQRQEAVMAALEQQSRLTVDTLRTQTNQLVDLRGNISQSLREILDRLETMEELTGQNQRQLGLIRDQIDRLQRTGGMATGGAGGETPGEMGGGSSAEEIYNESNEAYMRGSLSAARLGFQQFLQSHPTHEELAPLVHLRLADVYVQEGSFERAVEEFHKIEQRFPGSDQVPQALYRIGLLYVQEMDREEEGRGYLERVVNTWPDSDAADLARRVLEGQD